MKMKNPCKGILEYMMLIKALDKGTESASSARDIISVIVIIAQLL
jgi:hypothetical protein